MSDFHYEGSLKYRLYHRNCILPYSFGYKIELFSFQNSPKDLDPSYKMDLDLWDCKVDLELWYCYGRVKLVL